MRSTKSPAKVIFYFFTRTLPLATCNYFRRRRKLYRYTQFSWTHR